jgi:hypothetical protein
MTSLLALHAVFIIYVKNWRFSDIVPPFQGNSLNNTDIINTIRGDKSMQDKLNDSLEQYKDVLSNPVVRAVGGWKCGNHDDPTDEARYVAKAEADLGAFSEKIDRVLAHL